MTDVIVASGLVKRYGGKTALEATPGLAVVRQPWPSFDLRPQETASGWITRVAERLRHRARALTPWDCERLVLQAFPEVFKLKCIPRSETGEEPTIFGRNPERPRRTFGKSLATMAAMKRWF